MKKLAIYGAGYIGKGLLKMLEREGIPVDCFCVDGNVNAKNIESGKPVLLLEEIASESSRFYLPAVHEIFLPQIENSLKSFGIENYLLPPKHILQMIDESSFLSRLEITPIIGCKVNCRFCPQNVLIKKYRSVGKKNAVMALEDYKKCIDNLPKEVIVNFAGMAEPFLHPDAVEMIRYAHETGHPVELFTTLVGMTKEKFNRIRDIPFRRFALHVADREGYAHIPVTREYLELLSEITDVKKATGEPFVEFANCQSEPHPEVLKITEGKISVTWNLIDRAGNLTDDKLPHVCHEGAIYCCRSLYLKHNVLIPDGSVLICCMDYGMKHVVGNLLKETWEEIHDGDKIKELKNQMSVGEIDDILCKYCEAAISLK